MSLSILLDSSPPVVDSVRSSLEAKEGFWFACLLIASAGVAVGCVLEIPETWTDLKEWRHLKKDKTTPHPGWRVPMAAIGLLLVVGGVVGEGIFEGLVSINETKLRAHDEQALTDTIKESGTAKESAEKAQKAAELASEASGAAMSKATDASGKADSVFGIAEKAGKAANGALSEAGDAKAQLATVDAKIQSTAANVERVDEKFSFRELDPRKRSLFIDALKSALHKPTEPVQMEAFMSVVDGTTYGSEIGDAMNDPSTGWKAGQTAASSLSGTCKGVVLSVPVDERVPIWARDLQQALLVSGIGGGITHRRDQAEDTVILLVCPKN
jgi:hypothetical protein